MSLKVRRIATLIALLIVVAVGAYGAWYEGRVDPAEVAYLALVADHPLTSIVEAVEVYSHTQVIGHEFITATEGTDSMTMLWLHQDPSTTQEQFEVVHKVALTALLAAFPDCTDYVIVFAVITEVEDGVYNANGMAAMWMSRAGAEMALTAEDYAIGVGSAIAVEEAAIIQMQLYGFPLLESPWYPRRADYVFPAETPYDNPDADAA